VGSDAGVESVCCWGGFWTGTPVKECRRGGIVVGDCAVGVRIRRRRGLGMFLILGFEVVVAGFVGGEDMMSVGFEDCIRI
jgi:hypothetical protein